MVWLVSLWTSECVWLCECMLDWNCVYCCMFPILSSGRSYTLLLFLSPASAFRTEACKDMHAFILMWVWGKSVKSACWLTQSEANPPNPSISMFFAEQLIRTNHSISTSDFAQLVDLSPFFASVSFTKSLIKPRQYGLSFSSDLGFPECTASCYKIPKKENMEYLRDFLPMMVWSNMS